MFQQVYKRFLHYNQGALNLLFETYSLIEAKSYKGEPHTWEYTFKDCIVKCFPDQRGTCGDAGGFTMAYRPCARKCAHGGRCQKHRVCGYVKLVMRDADIRPFPVSELKVTELTVDNVQVKIDVTLPSWVSMEHAWSAEILHVKQELQLPLTTCIVLNDQTFHVDPLWPTDKVLNIMCQEQIVIQGRTVTRGYVLQDVGIHEGDHVLASC